MLLSSAPIAIAMPYILLLPPTPLTPAIFHISTCDSYNMTSVDLTGKPQQFQLCINYDGRTIKIVQNLIIRWLFSLLLHSEYIGESEHRRFGPFFAWHSRIDTKHTYCDNTFSRFIYQNGIRFQRCAESVFGRFEKFMVIFNDGTRIRMQTIYTRHGTSTIYEWRKHVGAEKFRHSRGRRGRLAGISHL